MSGALHWTPDVFWRATFPELYYSYMGLMKTLGVDISKSDYPTREELEKLKEQFPDG